MAADQQPTRILIVKGLGGLGNRLLGLLTAILYGQLTGRQLVVDWSDPPYSRDGENVFPLLFTSPASLLTPVELRGRSIAPEAWNGRPEATVNQQMDRIGRCYAKSEWTRLTVDPARLNYQEEVVVYCSRFERIHEMRRNFRGEFRHLADKSDEQILRDLVRTEIVLRPELAGQVERFRGRHFADEIVGVHVRNSDLSLGVEKLLRCTDKILASRHNCKVFMATDNIDNLHQARRRYGVDRLLATEKWFPAPGRPIHWAAERGSQLQTAREALVDLYLLGACDWLVADWRSSFAYVAWLLFRGPRSRVRNSDPGRFLPRHIGHRLGLWQLRLRHAVNQRKPGWKTNPTP
jgi:hypothetical protein